MAIQRVDLMAGYLVTSKDVGWALSLVQMMALRTDAPTKLAFHLAAM